MSGINSLILNGQVQTNNQGTTSSNKSSTNSSTSDVNIFPVNSSLDASNYVYDGQTILMINSTLNPNSNLIKAQYFDPVNGSNGMSGSFGFIDWNFNLTSSSYLNGSMSASSLLSEQTTLYNNLQPFNNSLGNYSLDITDGNTLTSNGSSTKTLFFSLTSQPYVCYKGDFVNGTPTYDNVNPNYSSNNSDNFIFTSNYYTQQKNEILIIQLVFTVSNTNSLNVSSTSSSTPIVSVIVYNKIISQADLANGNISNSKVYTAGPIPLQYMQSGSTFNPLNGNFNIYNNIPIIIAEGYSKLYSTIPLIYVPPVNNNDTYNGQYLNNGNYSTCHSIPGYYISNNTPTVPLNGASLNSTEVPFVNQITYGHFVVGIAYSSDFATYNPGTTISSEVLIKNIWRSPISIYNSYQAFSVNDMATKLVVLLFGKSQNGGTFLVTNTGTLLKNITNYAVTSLKNFMNIMNVIITSFDGNTSLVDYFINQNVANNINAQGYNIQTVIVQPLLDGSILNPPTVSNCPNMYYLFLNNSNSSNMTVDPSQQLVFGQNINQPYFGLQNSVLCSSGDGMYYSSTLSMLEAGPTNKYLFANSLYIGLNVINNQSYYMLIILPEALFNGVPISTSQNVLSIFATNETLFYLTAVNNTSSRFVPSNYTVSGSSSNKTSSYNINKIVLSVSNNKLI